MNIKQSLLTLFVGLAVVSGLQARVGFGFSFGFPCNNVHFGVCAPVYRPCHAPCIIPVCEPRVSFGVSIPMRPRPWKITNETDDIIVVTNRCRDTIIQPYTTKSVARTGNKLAIFAQCSGEEFMVRPSSSRISVIEDRFGYVDIV